MNFESYCLVVKNMTNAFETRLKQVHGKPSQPTKIVYTKQTQS